MIDSLIRIIVITLFFFMHVSCIDKDVYEGDNGLVDEYISYLYPYQDEAQNAVAGIAFILNNVPENEEVKAMIPHLKYNKTWLFMLTQDDCKHAAYSATWAAINGKPLSSGYFYNTEQLAARDLPPDFFTLGKTLCSTDGTGREVRFAFTTTLSPEWEWMDKESTVINGFSNNYNRFSMKSGLTWSNVMEMLAFDTGIAFHDVNTNSVNNKDSLLKHFGIAQEITLEKLSGRGLKILAEPSGNYDYLLVDNPEHTHPLSGNKSWIQKESVFS